MEAPQDQAPLWLDVLDASKGPSRVIQRDIENRGDLALLFAVANRQSVPAAAQRQRQRIEKDRLAGSRLPRQRGQSRTEGEIEAINQDDVANDELGQHDHRPYAISASQTESPHHALRFRPAGR